MMQIKMTFDDERRMCELAGAIRRRSADCERSWILRGDRCEEENEDYARLKEDLKLVIKWAEEMLYLAERIRIEHKGAD